MSAKRHFAIIDITDSGAGHASGWLGAPAGVQAGRYALVPAHLIDVVPSPGLPQYSCAVLRDEALSDEP